MPVSKLKVITLPAVNSTLSNPLTHYATIEMRTYKINDIFYWFSKHPSFKNNFFFTFKTLDVDECSVDSTPCDENADCANSEGSYRCTCKQGFTGDGTVCEGKSNILSATNAKIVFRWSKFPFSPDHHCKKIIKVVILVNFLWIFKGFFHVHDGGIAENRMSWPLKSFRE